MGAVKTVVIDLNKIVGVDRRPDGIALHCEGKQVVESFKIAQDLKLGYLENGKHQAVPFSGPILERIVSQAMARHGGQHVASAA